VLTSNSSSLGEIAGDAAETVDPTDTEAIVEAMRRLATNAELRRARSARGLVRSRDFSWTQTAREMLAVYQRLAGVAMPAPAAAAIENAERAVRVESTVTRNKVS
jgi:glycosyltransferase involved in cell wall biosynthesis